MYLSRHQHWRSTFFPTRAKKNRIVFIHDTVLILKVFRQTWNYLVIHLMVGILSYRFRLRRCHLEIIIEKKNIFIVKSKPRQLSQIHTVTLCLCYPIYQERSHPMTSDSGPLCRSLGKSNSEHLHYLRNLLWCILAVSTRRHSSRLRSLFSPQLIKHPVDMASPVLL